MPRSKMTEDELKVSKQERNKEYYQKNKVSTKQAVVYVISGLGDGKCYVGVSNNFQQRQQAHRCCFGDVEISPVLKFHENVSLGIMNNFERLIITQHIGKENCINTNNSYLPQTHFQKHHHIQEIREHIHLLEEESKILAEECLLKIEGLNVA